MALPLSDPTDFLALYSPESVDSGGSAAAVDIAAVTSLFLAMETHISSVLGFAAQGGTVESSSYVLYLETGAGDKLWLPVPAVTAVASVYDDSTHLWGSTTQVTSFALVTGKAPYLSLDVNSSVQVFSSGERNAKVSFTAGWTSGTWPLQGAVFFWASRVWSNRRNQGADSFGSDGFSTSRAKWDLSQGMPKEVALMVAEYAIVSG